MIVLRSLPLVLAGSVLSGSLAADTLPEPWQSKREAAQPLTDRACEGDPEAMAEVAAKAQAGDPVMMSNIGWLWDHCATYEDLPELVVAVYDMRAAEAGYPIGQYFHGINLLDGMAGRYDPEAGIKALEAAAEGGYLDAALDLIDEYVSGEYVSKDLDKAEFYLERARALGADETDLELAEEDIAFERSEQ